MRFLQISLCSSLLVACGGAETRTTTPTTPSSPAETSAATTTAAAPVTPAAPTAPTASAASGSVPTPTPTPTGTDSAPTTTAPPASASAVASPPKKVAARHILIQWMGCQSADAAVVRTRDQARAVAQDVLRRVKAGEDFARLVIDFSDEPNAGARGGSVGRFGHGAMVKEFEEAAFALKPGEVSGIVESPFGFHIIQRTE